MQLHAGVSFIWCCVCVAGPLALFCPGKGLASINEQNEGIDIDSLILWTRKAQLRDVILKPCFLLRLKWLTVIFSLDRTKIHVGFDTTLQSPLQIIFDDQGKIYNIKGTCKCYLRKFKLFSGWKKNTFVTLGHLYMQFGNLTFYTEERNIMSIWLSNTIYWIDICHLPRDLFSSWGWAMLLRVFGIGQNSLGHMWTWALLGLRDSLCRRVLCWWCVTVAPPGPL